MATVLAFAVIINFFKSIKSIGKLIAWKANTQSGTCTIESNDTYESLKKDALLYPGLTILSFVLLVAILFVASHI